MAFRRHRDCFEAALSRPASSALLDGGAISELDTVTGLMKKNGTLVEANVYDAYGHVNQWGYRNFDFDRDGDVDSSEYGYVLLMVEFSGQGISTMDPMTDGDMDGDCDATDLGMVVTTQSGAPPITLRTSSVGNPYYFTGSRLTLHEDVSVAGASPNKELQYNRARHYDPVNGRWLQRDPIGYKGGGMNLYEYAMSRPTTLTDPQGMKPITCPKGQVPVSNGQKPTVNGCGAGWTQYIVPDYWPPLTRDVHLTPACNAHDKCYADCKKSKAQCDREFREDITVACVYAYQLTMADYIWTNGVWSLTLTGKAKVASFKACKEIAARAYEKAVSALGEGAHTAAQKEHCKCACPPKKEP